MEQAGGNEGTEDTNVVQADVHAADEEQGAVRGVDLLGGEVEVDTELEPDEEEEEDNEEDDEEGQDVQIDKDDPHFDDMIASGHIKLKVRASG